MEQRIVIELQQRLDWLTRNSTAISDARTEARPNPLHALDRIATATRGQAVALSAFHSADHGFNAAVVTLGNAASDAVRTTLTEGADVPLTQRGDCRSFALRGALENAVAAADVDRTTLVFDHDVDAHCSTPRNSTTNLTLRDGAGDLTLHATALQLGDLFRVLHELTGANFLVRDDVRGSIDADVSNGTVSALLARVPADVTSGGLHIVRPPHAPPLAINEQSYSGEPLSLQLTDADVNDIFCMFGRITALSFTVPATFHRQTSAYVRDLPWDQVVDALVAANDMTYRIDGTTVAIGTGALRDACQGGTSPPAWWKIAPEHLAVEDLRVAALGRAAKSEWKAFGYAPGNAHSLIVLARGARLGDAEVSDVGPAGVVFTRGGRTITRKIERTGAP